MSEGWIKVYRQIQDCWIWSEDDKFDKAHAWLDLLLLANHKDKKISVDGKPVVITRGQFLTSIVKLSSRWNWDRKTTTKFLNVLENDGMLVQNKTNRWTTITIVNYGIYQESTDSKKDNSMDKSMDNCLDNSMDTNKNVKNVKNEKNILPKGNSRAFCPPNLEEVKAYCLERNNTVDAEKWFDFYASKGWFVGKNKMKDWKAAVRTWEKSSSSYGNGKGNNNGNNTRSIGTREQGCNTEVYTTGLIL